jgi:hypothetical protein
MVPDGMAWLVAALRSWEAISRNIREREGCPDYLERAERAAEYYRRMIERARKG